MEAGQYNPDPELGGNRSSAATIDHTEIHMDEGKPKESLVINTSGGVHYANEQAKVVVQTKPKKPKDFVVTSCFVIMFCNCCFGLAGWHYGLKANNAWELGDQVECKMQAKRAKIFVILGVIAGITTWVLALVLFFTVSPFRPGA